MISHRLRGLLNLHMIVTTGVAALLFCALAIVATYTKVVPFLRLQQDLPLLSYVLCVIGGVVVSARYLAQFGHRIHRLSWVDSTRITSRQVVCIALFLFALLFVLKDRAISRLFVGSYLVTAWFVLLFVNQGLPRLLARILFRTRHKIPTLFVGSAARAERLGEWLAAKEALGLRSVGFITPAESESGAGRSQFVGALADIKHVIAAEGVAQVIVLDMPATRGEMRFILEVCQEMGCRLLIHSDLSEQLQHPLTPVIDEGSAFYSLQEEPLEDPLNRVLKRTFDVAVSLPIVLFVLPPLCAWVWMVQRWQARGPLFFVQRRAGQRGNEFFIYKFRSMYANDENRQVEAVQASRGDQRIYPFGKFLRQSSLDEFPQFFNVLKGDMSIVGPRPHMPVHDEEFAKHFNSYRTRHFAKPGITGLAQTKGFRGEISDPELLRQRIANDIYYIANWSIWMDVSITFKTTWQVLFPPKTAY